MRVSRAFNVDLASMVNERPAALSRQPNRWNKADLVTWEEVRLEDVEGVHNGWLRKIRPLLDRLAPVRKPLQESIPNQIIHGDMLGNILWDVDAARPPAIIDLTFYWRPAEYSGAIVVADGLAWYGEGRALVELFGTDDPSAPAAC